MPQTPPAGKRKYKHEGAPYQSDWLERLAHFNTQFGRFVRDGLGVALIAFAAMMLFAILESIFTQLASGGDIPSNSLVGGLVLVPLTRLLRNWFGLGSLFIVLGIGYLGYALVRRERGGTRWGRVIPFEVASLLTLGLFAVFGGNDLLAPEAGWYGGTIGWGLAALLWRVAGVILGTLILLVLWLLAAITAFGGWTRLEVWLMQLAGEAHPQAVASPTPAEAHVEETQKPKSAPRKKAPAIPPEFRTSLKPAAKKEEKTLKPPPRADDLPPLSILLGDSAARADERTINQTAGLIMKTLSEFGIPATVIGYRVGSRRDAVCRPAGVHQKAGHR
ncbi:MAG: hypothetical protein HND47_20935 [Chloroflexi bacterium]|nr:hypothetical protein [Chloroflexota bacterium]